MIDPNEMASRFILSFRRRDLKVLGQFDSVLDDTIDREQSGPLRPGAAKRPAGPALIPLDEREVFLPGNEGRRERSVAEAWSAM